LIVLGDIGFLLVLMLILAQFSLAQFFDVFAEEGFVPNWVLRLSEFWDKGDITDKEFTDAVQYLQDQNIVQLVMDREYDTITNFLITVILDKEEPIFSQLSTCSSDWYITGYFTPIESDYSGDFKRIAFGDNIKHFRADFLEAVKIEGWGKTRLGDYVGWYDNSFHLSDSALDMHGNKLLVPSVAVDTLLIKQKAKLAIPTLPTPWNEMVFTASDIGPSIKGKHIDIYTGEGKQAELETYRITGTKNQVCVEAMEE